MAKQRVWATTFVAYTIGDAVGEGGSGTVFAATDNSGAQRAVKVLDARKATTERRKRFQNEVQFCQASRHPNIVRVIDHGLTPDGEPFFVMPLYPDTLRGYISRTLDPAGALRVFVGVLDGAEAAHKLGVYHRDLKPENILIDSAGMPIVADFGIAHFEQDELYTAVETKNEARLANFVYAAPEQKVRGGAVDLRADVFALGLMLNELYTKQVPAGSNHRRIADAASSHAYLDEVVDAMTRQNPSERPAAIDAVKKLLIGRGQEWISRQKLDELSKQVVKAADISGDRLIADPMRIVGVDYRQGDLFFKLNHEVPAAWQRAMHNVGGPYSYGCSPADLRIESNLAVIPAGPGREGEVKRRVEIWIDRANQIYAEDMKREAAERERAEKRALKAEQEAQEYRASVLRQLNP